MNGLLTKAEGRSAFVESMIRVKRRVRGTPFLGPAPDESTAGFMGAKREGWHTNGARS